MSWWGFLSESCKCAPYRHHNSRHFDKLATEGSSDSVLQEGQEHVPPATVLPLVSESEPLLIKPEPKAEIKAITLLDERPIYAINLTEQSNADGTTVGSDNQKLTAEWLDAKLKIMSLTKPMYICASVQLLAEGLLLGPGLFNLVDWALAALGACSCLLVLTSCCTLLETGLFYAILLNLLAVVLEFIPIGNFIAAGVEHTDRRGVFGIFPGFMLSWRFALGLAAYEFVVVLIRLACIVCTWRYREAVLIIADYNEQQRLAEKRRALNFKPIGDALQAMRAHSVSVPSVNVRNSSFIPANP